MDIIRLAMSGALLFLGRKLFWFFVGVVGFVYGSEFAAQFFHIQSEKVILVIALLTGLLGALLAILLQKAAIWVAGFLAGGYLVISLMDKLNLAVWGGWGTGPFSWVIFVIGGIIGAVMLAYLFNWTLIVLSSLTGSLVIIENFQFNQLQTKILFVILFLAGIIIQARQRG